jgi:hypothetical protein
LAISLLLVSTGIVFLAPIIPITIENKQNTVSVVKDLRLTLGEISPVSIQIQKGTDVVFSVSATGTVRLYIFNSAQYDKGWGSSQPTSVEQLLDVSSGKIDYHVSSTDTYYFWIAARSIDGNRRINSANVTMYWQEESISFNQVSKQLTIWQMINSSLNLSPAKTGSIVVGVKDLVNNPAQWVNKDITVVGTLGYSNRKSILYPPSYAISDSQGYSIDLLGSLPQNMAFDATYRISGKFCYCLYNRYDNGGYAIEVYQIEKS